MPRKTFYLHIGCHKAGSSSIQLFLNKNRDLLIEKGLYLPLSSLEIQHFKLITKVAFEYGMSVVYEIPIEVQRQNWNALIQEAVSSKCDRIIVSSEHLGAFAKENTVNMIREALEGHDVKIIYYARRHDSFIISLYNQMLKSKCVTPDECMESYLNVDYNETLDMWARHFGDNNILVRPFESSSLKGTLIEDFLDCLGEGLDERFIIPHKVNEAKPKGLLSAEMVLSTLAKDSEWSQSTAERFHHFLAQMPQELWGKECTFSPYSPAQLTALLAANEDSYRKVAQRFLGRKDGVLFREPVPDYSHHGTNFDLESLFIITCGLFLHTEKKLNRLKRKFWRYKIKALFRKLLKR